MRLPLQLTSHAHLMSHAPSFSTRQPSLFTIFVTGLTAFGLYLLPATVQAAPPLSSPLSSPQQEKLDIVAATEPLELVCGETVRLDVRMRGELADRKQADRKQKEQLKW